MTALGMKILPPPAVPAASTQKKPVTRREPQSTSIKNEPMTPAIHNDSRNSERHHQNKKKMIVNVEKIEDDEDN